MTNQRLTVPTFAIRLFSIFCAVVLLLTAAPTFALPQNDVEAIHRDSVHYDNTAPGSACGLGIALTGNSNAAKAFNFFVSKGLQPHQAAGIVGNLLAESGLIPNRMQGAGNQTISSTDPIKADIANGDDPSLGFGIAQWTSPGRQKAWLDFADKNKADALSLELELAYLIHELETGSYGYAELKKAGDLRQATWIFLAFFEKPATVIAAGKAGDPVQPTSGPAKDTLDVRVGLAEGASSGGSSGASAGSESSCPEDSEGEIVSADGFTFPLKTTREAILKGSGSVWCYKNTKNCHHDYNAADIFAPTGTTVVATRGGTVLSARDNDSSSVGSRVTIMGDDGKLYYYAHMGEGTIRVRDRQKISAGTPLGNVGTSADAAGTDPHLHIDALPGDSYDYRPNCSGPDCSGYPFVNIQPVMAEVFKSVK